MDLMRRNETWVREAKIFGVHMASCRSLFSGWIEMALPIAGLVTMPSANDRPRRPYCRRHWSRTRSVSKEWDATTATILIISKAVWFRFFSVRTWWTWWQEEPTFASGSSAAFKCLSNMLFLTHGLTIASGTANLICMYLVFYVNCCDREDWKDLRKFYGAKNNNQIYSVPA